MLKGNFNVRNQQGGLTWDRRSKLPKESPLIANLIRAAEHEKAKPLFFSPRHQYARFLGIAAYRQMDNPEEAIQLPQVSIARILGINPQRIGQYCRQAVRTGYLTKTAEHDSSNRKPAEYRFNLEKPQGHLGSRGIQPRSTMRAARAQPKR
jgi:hypothetical protein